MNATNLQRSRMQRLSDWLYDFLDIVFDKETWATVFGLILSIMVVIVYEEHLKNSLLLKLLVLPFILIAELLFPVFALRRAYKYWRMERKLAKESLLVGILGCLCLVGFVKLAFTHDLALSKSMGVIALAAVYLAFIMWNDHLREKV